MLLVSKSAPRKGEQISKKERKPPRERAHREKVERKSMKKKGELTR